MTPPTVTVVGSGRAGGSFAAALAAARWHVVQVPARAPSGLSKSAHSELAGSGEADLVLLCVPDAAVAAVAASLRVRDDAVVAHCAGSLGLDVLAPHPRRGAVHPLVALPDPERGAMRLRGAWFAVAGDPLMGAVVEALGGHVIEVDDDQRSSYHAAACVAANHLVALMGQVERIAPEGVPLGAYLDLARGALEDVAAVGPAAALTGPVARGDATTVAAHLDAIDPSERAAYLALADAAARLVSRPPPSAAGPVST